MHLALLKRHEEAARILARKGADCTEDETATLDEHCTSFLQLLQQQVGQRTEGHGVGTFNFYCPRMNISYAKQSGSAMNLTDVEIQNK